MAQSKKKPSKSDLRHYHLAMLGKLSSHLSAAREENAEFQQKSRADQLLPSNRYMLRDMSGELFEFLAGAVQRAIEGAPDPFGVARQKGIQGRARWERWRIAEYVVRRTRDIGFEAAREEAAELFWCGGGPNGSVEQFYREFRAEVEAHERVWARTK